MSDFEDDIARAISLSLQDKPSSNNTLDSDEGYEDEDLIHQDQAKAPIPKAPIPSSMPQDNIPRTTTKSATASEPQPPAPALTFLSERQKLEQERLARQKRMRKDAGLDDEEEERKPPAKRQHISSASTDVRRANDNGGRSAPVASSSKSVNLSPSTGEELFWDGEWRPTATKRADPRKDGRPTFRLTQILGKKTEIAFAIVSSFSFDIPWTYQFFDPSTPVIAVGHSEDGKASIRNILPNWIRVTPSLRGYGCQHMKFMLLFYKSGRLRILISTANLIDYDWRDIENAAWVQDIPLRTKPLPVEIKASDDFPSTFQRVLQALGVDPAIQTTIKQGHPNIPLKTISDLRSRWDFSKVKAHLVPSLAGKHEGWQNILQVGHPRLMKVVRSMRLIVGSSKELSIECQGSSTGTYTAQWINEFYLSARGLSTQEWLDRTKKYRENRPYPTNVKIMFPSLKTVRESVLGEPGGGTMFMRRNQWSAAKFPRHLFHDSKSRAGNVLMHTKMILGTVITKPKPISIDSDSEEEDEVEVVEPEGWLYLGSHNFTPSAWGTLSGSGFNPILNVANYELGVVLPLTKGADETAVWERPPKRYEDTGDSPWIQGESAYFKQ